ncbi:MAG: DUF465 domain-containing protein [Acidobacteria bacterium]|nr:DUF465 domain-containing protein [Acidobacteriota bacterium]
MEFTTESELKAHLIQTSPHFRSLSVQIETYKKLIDELESKAHLTADDEMEEHRLKKLKLQAKDEMRQMMARYQPEPVS